MTAEKHGHLLIKTDGQNPVSLPKTLDCGQAFRWRSLANDRWRGIAGGRAVELEETDGGIILFDTPPEQEPFWREYFDLGRDYAPIFALGDENELLAQIFAAGRGIRLLNQAPFETICSFIISANNNIPRIKGIIERLCRLCGRHIGGDDYDFPAPGALCGLTVEELAPIRAGFRAKYILDAARKAASGEVPPYALRAMDTEEARLLVMTIKGVGPKVADCALLFGAGHISCFPRDVWIKRAMETLFPAGLPEKALPFAGIVQQYIFDYIRNLKNIN